MKNILLYLSLFLFATTIVGCSSSSDGEIELDSIHIFVREYGGSGQTTFTSSNISEYSVTSYPDGWTIEVSKSDKTVTAFAPEEDDDTAEKAGIVYITATTPDDDDYYVSIIVSVADHVDLDDPSNDLQANSFVVSEPNTVYSFNPNRRGESTTEVAQKAVDCEITWRTSGYPIRFAEMTDDGRISFYTYPDWDGDDLIISEGNAIISALGDNDEILWSWHIWITEKVNDVDVAGLTFMDRNIGATMNDNTSEDNILYSYGMYYQWGRKDPFIYPDTYNASGSEDALLYNEDGVYFEITNELSNALYGTILYTQLNPNVFITGDDDSNRDWLWGGNQNGELWGTNGEKSIYDPSPKGYRVPTSAEYALLSLDDSESLTLESYGRTLSGELFMAYGVRTYLDYSIQNYKSDGSYARWAGYYWSTDSNGSDAEALYFDNDGKIEITTAHRATGMQIRAVKM